MRLGGEHERRHLERFPDHIDLGELPWAEQPEATRGGRRRRARHLPGRPPRRDRRSPASGSRSSASPTSCSRPAAATRSATRSSPAAIGTDSTEIGLQLETYGWLYEQTFGEPPVALQVHTGIGEIHAPPLRGRRRALEAFERDPDRLRPAEQEPENTSACRSARAAASSSAAGRRRSERRVGLLPWVDRGLIAELDPGRRDMPSSSSASTPRASPRSSGPGARGAKRSAPRRADPHQRPRLAEDRPILLAPPAIPETRTT